MAAIANRTALPSYREGGHIDLVLLAKGKWVVPRRRIPGPTISNVSAWPQVEVPKCTDSQPVLALKPKSAGRCSWGLVWHDWVGDGAGEWGFLPLSYGSVWLPPPLPQLSADASGGF